MGFPSSLHDLPVTATCPDSGVCNFNASLNATYTIAERFNLTVRDPPQTLREEFIQKGPGLIGFDYALSGFTAETLPPPQYACGLGPFEAISLFLAYVFIGIVATMVVHDPCQKWINTHLLGGKKKDKPSFTYEVQTTVLDYSRALLAAQGQVSSLVKDVFASNDGSESWSALFSDAPKANALPENIKKSKAGEAAPTAQEKV